MSSTVRESYSIELGTTTIDINSQTKNGDDYPDKAEEEKETDIFDGNACTRWIERIEEGVDAFLRRYKALLGQAVRTSLFLAYLTYFMYCMTYRVGDEGSYILMFITFVLVAKVLRQTLDCAGKNPSLPSCVRLWGGCRRTQRLRIFLRVFLYVSSFCGLSVFLVTSVLMSNPRNGQSLVGIAVLIFLCFIFSTKPSKVNWHPVYWGFIVQFAFSALTLYTKAGFRAFQWLGDAIQDFISLSDAGAEFVISKNFKDLGLVFTIAGIIVLVNSFIFMLNHWGVIEFIVLKLGRGLAVALDTGPVESVIAAANILMGLTEAPLLVRPYLPSVTRSELHAIMTCGFASIAGSAMAIFIRYGAPANHLLTAAVISAPAALAVTKLMCPETERVNYANQKNIRMRDDSQQQTALQAAMEGSLMAMKMLAAIAANMIAFVSLLALIDACLEWLGRRAGYEGLKFDLICSYLLYPVALAMGASPSDCGRIGSLIGIKLFATPVVGYIELGKIIQNRRDLEDYVFTTNGSWHWEGSDIILEASNTTLLHGVMEERSEVISTYAMCGYSAFTAIGICIATLVPMCPTRKKDIIDLIFRAFIAGNVASFLTGAVAGVMYTEEI